MSALRRGPQRSVFFDLLINAGGLGLASWLLDGFVIGSGWSFVGLVLFTGFLNAFLKPFLIFFALPFVVLTLGLGLWVINSIILYFAGSIIPGVLVEGFTTALLAAAIVSLAGMALNMFTMRSSVRVRVNEPSPKRTRLRRAKRDDDVIDV